MEILHNFCATANIRDLPGEHVSHILINVVDDCATDSSIAATEKLLLCARPVHKMMDSGGYHLLQREEKGQEILHDSSNPIKYSGKLNLTPHHEVEAARVIRPNTMIALDFPIRKLSNHAEQEIEFKQKLEYNVPWAIETAKQRQRLCPEIELLIPIQAYNLSHLDTFLKSIGPISFDGFCFPTRTLKLGGIALFLTAFHELGIRRVHLLGVSAFFPMALAAYMARHFFDWVSLDARTWKIMAKHSTYLNPHNLSGVYIGNNVPIDESIPVDCPCPWCKNQTFTYIKHLRYSGRRVVLGCHNFWVTQKAGRDLYNNAGTIDELIRYLRTKSDRTEEIEALFNALYLIEVHKGRDIRYLEELLV